MEKDTFQYRRLLADAIRVNLEEEIKEKREKIETLRSEECAHQARANELAAQIEQIESTP